MEDRGEGKGRGGRKKKRMGGKIGKGGFQRKRGKGCVRIIQEGRRIEDDSCVRSIAPLHTDQELASLSY